MIYLLLFLIIKKLFLLEVLFCDLVFLLIEMNYPIIYMTPRIPDFVIVLFLILMI